MSDMSVVSIRRILNVSSTPQLRELGVEIREPCLLATLLDLNARRDGLAARIFCALLR